MWADRRCVVAVVHSYNGDGRGHLAVELGDRLVVLRSCTQGWYYGYKLCEPCIAGVVPVSFCHRLPYGDDSAKLLMWECVRHWCDRLRRSADFAVDDNDADGAPAPMSYLREPMQVYARFRPEATAGRHCDMVADEFWPRARHINRFLHLEGLPNWRYFTQPASAAADLMRTYHFHCDEHGDGRPAERHGGGGAALLALSPVALVGDGEELAATGAHWHAALYLYHRGDYAKPIAVSRIDCAAHPTGHETLVLKLHKGVHDKNDVSCQLRIYYPLDNDLGELQPREFGFALFELRSVLSVSEHVLPVWKHGGGNGNGRLLCDSDTHWMRTGACAKLHIATLDTCDHSYDIANDIGRELGGIHCARLESDKADQGALLCFYIF